ncbi:iron-containing alcohol dehydrogenase [Natronococcus sp. JC468]|uniref:iron-containing alcohol dehydrogenase family protein n=1 Tax=Natronococcus sp. JC468 TaxID=1961921 RepID=UPI00143BC4D8|nr:iron-containing alcohol dehydrogenase family protein [Natronococcus sp. JC468]NKE35636.1 iron-containing alcohol dehydrogenase [Natronococcus sp. JC468]
MTANDPTPREASFRFEYHPATIRFGAGCADALEDELERLGLERALVVCGATVGSTPEVIDPVREGLGDRLAGVFDETTPDKRLGTAFDGLDRFEDADADAVVALGGGSSLDVAKAVSALAASDRSRDRIAEEFAQTGTIDVPDDPVPIVAVPTTLAGAALSTGAGITAAPDSGLVDEELGGGISDPGLMPTAAFYDPELVATTPDSILAGSAMNGFDKGLETIYAANATPVTDATARHGLEKLEDGLEAFGRGDRDLAVYETLLEGLLLVQYGISRPDGTTLSVVHAFGHGLRDAYDLQQGVAHAVVVPHVLRYLFEQEGVDARAGLLADALGVGEAADHGAAVVDRVAELRDELGLPFRLRDLEPVADDEFGDVAEAILADGFMANAPPGLDPTVEEIESVLEEAW